MDALEETYDYDEFCDEYDLEQDVMECDNGKG